MIERVGTGKRLSYVSLCLVVTDRWRNVLLLTRKYPVAHQEPSANYSSVNVGPLLGVMT